jgi:hypothetical protein
MLRIAARICVSSIRFRLFGNVRLALLCSGSFGRTHTYSGILDLANLLIAEKVRFVFSVRGNRDSELRSTVKQRSLVIPFVPFANACEQRSRLGVKGGPYICSGAHNLLQRTDHLRFRMLALQHFPLLLNTKIVLGSMRIFGSTSHQRSVHNHTSSGVNLSGACHSHSKHKYLHNQFGVQLH